MDRVLPDEQRIGVEEPVKAEPEVAEAYPGIPRNAMVGALLKCPVCGETVQVKGYGDNRWINCEECPATWKGWVADLED